MRCTANYYVMGVVSREVFDRECKQCMGAKHCTRRQSVLNKARFTNKGGTDGD